MSESAEHSEEAAAEALRAAFQAQKDSEEPEPEAPPVETDEVTPDPPAAEHSEPSQEPVAAESAASEEETPEEPPETVAKADHDRQIAEIQGRANQAIEWAKGLGLRKATEADAIRKKAADLVGRIKRGEEVDQAELEALASEQAAAPAQPAPAYTQPPSPFAPQVAPSLTDDQALAVQQFAISSGLNDEQIAERAQWMMQPGNMSPRDAAVAQSDLYAFLSLGNLAYERTQAAGDPNRAKAAKAASRAQKTAAKAASAASGRGGVPTPPDTSPKLPDVNAMSDEDRWDILGKAMRQVVEENSG